MKTSKNEGKTLTAKKKRNEIMGRKRKVTRMKKLLPLPAQEKISHIWIYQGYWLCPHRSNARRHCWLQWPEVLVVCSRISNQSTHEGVHWHNHTLGPGTNNASIVLSVTQVTFLKNRQRAAGHKTKNQNDVIDQHELNWIEGNVGLQPKAEYKPSCEAW